mmetsp:Transcript_145775/g.257086  ORF Transcript_145775/g.257086 Transcript_145775/m.257086 type:complete len:481 (-) Transcript_145775:83-1525(-)
MVTTAGDRVVSDLPRLIAYGAPLKTVFHDLQNESDPSFLEAMAVISNEIIAEAQEMAQYTKQQAIDGKRFGAFQDDHISEDHLAVIMKYCAEDTAPPLYKEANDACYKPDRGSMNPFRLFVWLLVRALASLQPYLGTVVHRGVKLDLRSDYPQGREFTWQGFTSTTKDLSVLTNGIFLGDTGPRMIFSIELTQRQARDISAYSPMPEGEVLLPPGSRFRVIGSLQQSDLTIVHLLELASEEWILELSRGVTVEALEQQLQQTQQSLDETRHELEDERTQRFVAQENLASQEAKLQQTEQDLEEIQQKLEVEKKVVEELLASQVPGLQQTKSNLDEVQNVFTERAVAASGTIARAWASERARSATEWASASATELCFVLFLLTFGMSPWLCKEFLSLFEIKFPKIPLIPWVRGILDGEVSYSLYGLYNCLVSRQDSFTTRHTCRDLSEEACTDLIWLVWCASAACLCVFLIGRVCCRLQVF